MVETAMINHRYRITHELGAGGSAKVFLVEDTLQQNAPRALKVLTKQAPVSSAEPDQFLAEVSTLLSLHHPHLVTLYDFDIIRQAPDRSLVGHPFLLMEFVKGSDALAWADSLPPAQTKVKALRTLFGQCLSVLAFVHAHGIVHADIKPQNLLMADVGASAIPFLKLADFGISRRENSPTTTTPARGTLDYSAPEVLRGEGFDHRVDLYSVGATIFHLVEGHCPFEADDSVTLVKEILTTEPTFSSTLWSAMLDVRATVASLLNKAPADRPASALAALSMLEDGDNQTGTVPFVGRESELQRIHAAVHGPGASDPVAHPTAVLIHGPEGMGKTRLLYEAMRIARVGALRVFETAASGGGVPYSSLRPLLATLNAEASSFAAFRGVSLPEGNKLVRMLLAEPDAAADSDPAFRTRDREATVEVLARYVVECASLLPLLLFVDDADRMDENSAQVLQTVIREMPVGRTVIIGTASDESVWTGGNPTVEKIPLKDLTTDEVVCLAQSILGEDEIIGALGQRLHEILGGMPLVILEALRALQDSLDTKQLGAGVETALDVIERVIPRDADQLLLNRYKRLSTEKKIIFSFLCCFESPVPIAVLETHLPFHRASLRSALRSMEAAGLITVSSVDSRVAVRVARLKQSVYNSLSVDREGLHRMIATEMSSSSLEPSIAELQEMAYHFARTGEPEKASESLESAAARVLALQGHQHALALYRKAMEAAQSAGNPGRVLALQCRRAEALLRAGNTKDAVELGMSLLPNIPPADKLRRSILRTISAGRSRLGDFEEAKEGFSQLLAEATDENERAELTQELVNIEIALGGFRNAEETCLAQLEVAEELDHDELKGAILTDLGIATFLQGRYDDAARHFRFALGVYESLADEAHVVSAITNVGNALNARGDSEAAITQWRRALQYAVESGTLSQQAKIQNNLGIAYFNLGRYAEARASYRQSRETFQRLGMKSELTYTLTNLGEVMLADGDYGGAFSTWTEALALYEIMADVRGVVETDLQLAELRMIFGDLAEVERLVHDVERYIEADGVEPFKAMLKYWTAMLNATKRDFTSALDQLQEAHRLFVSSREYRKAQRSLLAIADCLKRAGDLTRAIVQWRHVLEAPENESSRLLMAEAKYMLGIAEREAPGSTTERPLMHFKSAMEIVEKEPICEVTWKLTYALAREYFERGQKERAHQNLVLTRKVLSHFASSLPSEELRSLYLAAEERGQVLANIERLLHNGEDETRRTT